ncbi:hypothetical protein AS219_02895 [Neorickettsia sp. 179522]|nr:hypothetical protein AS219_02895 [Neorickettsia sp. 179522]
MVLSVLQRNYTKGWRESHNIECPFYVWCLSRGGDLFSVDPFVMLLYVCLKSFCCVSLAFLHNFIPNTEHIVATLMLYKLSISMCT